MLEAPKWVILLGLKTHTKQGLWDQGFPGPQRLEFGLFFGFQGVAGPRLGSLLQESGSNREAEP